MRTWARRTVPALSLLALLAISLPAVPQAIDLSKFCYIQRGTSSVLCHDTRQDAEAAMRSDPAFAGIGQYLERFEFPGALGGTTPANPSVTLYYQIKAKPPTVKYTMYAAAMSGDNTGSFGCTPPAQDPHPDYASWCDNEANLVAAAQQRAMSTELAGCTLIGTILLNDQANATQGLVTRDPNNAQRGLLKLGTGYDAQYRTYRTSAQCPNESSPRTAIWNVLRHVSFLCPSGFVPDQGYERIDGLSCEPSNAEIVAITGPLQQCGSCPASPNPIYPATGEKARQEPDFSFAGRTFTRYYHSLGQFRNNRNFALGWTHTYSDFVSGYAGSPSVGMVSDEGVFESFVALGNGRYRGENSTDRVLESVTGGTTAWRLRQPDGEVREFNTNGKLIAIRHPADPLNAVMLTYTDDVLTAATDAQGRSLRFQYVNGLLARIVKPDGTVVDYGYDADVNLVSVDYGDNRIKRYHYHEAGLADPKFKNHLTGITAEDSQRFATFAYDSKGRVISSRVLGTPNEVTTANYPSNTQAVLTTANNETRTFTIQSGLYRRVTSATDSIGTEGRTFFTDGRLQTQTDKRNTVTRYEYTADYLSTTIQAEGTPEQRRDETTRDATTRLVTERRTLDAAGVLKAKTNWTHNARNQIVSVTATDPETSNTRTTAMTYCEAQDVSNGTCPIIGLLTKVDGPLAGSTDTTRFAYRMADEATCAAAPTTCPYRKGDLWRTTNALDHVTEILRADGAGRVLSVRDANGIVTDMTYDARGRLTASKVRGSEDSTELDDMISRIEYTPGGLVSRVIPPGGAYSQFEYDAGQRLTKITDAAGNRMSFTLNAAGERLKEDTQDASGTLLRTLSRTYDTLGRLWTQADAQHRATTFDYDKEDNLTLTTDALGHKTFNTYDPLGRLKTTLEDMDGIAAQTQYRYDALDRVTRIIDPNGLPTAYTYNGFGEVLTLDSPDTGIAMSTYDAAGNLRTRTDARGITATYGYDLLNRLTSASFPDTSLNASFNYDTAPAECPVGERYATGRLSAMTDASGATGYCYDRFGQLTRKLQITQGRSYALRYDYTIRAGRTGSDYLLRPRAPTGHLMGMTYPDGAKVQIGRNHLRQATDLTVTLANGLTKTLLGGAVYYPFGPVGQWTYGNGRTLQRSLNQNYQPGYVQDSAPGGISEGYWFDAAGNLESLRRADQQDPAKRKYEFDGLDRLTHVRDGTTNALLQQYAYDKTGNRSGRTDGATTTAYTYAPGKHRLMQVGTQNRSYDAAGNTTRIGGAAQTAVGQPMASLAIATTSKPQARPRGLRTEVWSRKAAKPKQARQRQSTSAQTNAATQALTPTTVREFVYDDTGRMRQVKHDGVVAMNYLYNGKGEQIHKFGSGAAITTMYDEQGRWIGDYDANGQPLQQAIWLDNLPVGLLVGAGANQKLFYIEADALGTPRVVIDPDRNVAVWRWDLANEAFGDSVPNEDLDVDGTAFVFNMRFPGQRYDSATGLNYNHYRDYEAGTGRYVQSDPLGLLGDISTFSYAESMPLTTIDRLGLSAEGVGVNSTADSCELCAPDRKRFYTKTDAARAVLSVVYIMSRNKNIEVCGLICRDSKTNWYFLGKGNTGDSASCEPGRNPCPKCSTATGAWHTHGAPDGLRESDAEKFSIGPKSDVSYANSNARATGDTGFTIFLGTPQGWLLSYSANSQVGTINRGRL